MRRATTPREPEVVGAALPCGSIPAVHELVASFVSSVLAISGFLEWFFAVALVGLVGAAGLFGVFVVVQLFRNPSRGARPRA